MSWLPKREKLDPVQAAAIDFAATQEGVKEVEKVGGGGGGDVGSAAKLALSVRHSVPV